MRSGVNNKGFAIVYSLIVLMLASIGGTALLFMTQQGHKGASDYAKMRSSSLAAVAALKSCEGQFQNDPNTALTLLKGYLQNNTNQWLLGTAPSGTAQKKKFWVGADAPEYAARIVSYDDTSHYIVIEGIGYGAFGGRKKVIGGYQLGGIGLSDVPIGTTHALFLGGQLENCNEPLSIKGDVFISAQGPGGPYNQHFNQGGKITGNVKTAASGNYLEIGQPLTITGNAFFQCGLWPQSAITINGRAGFTNGYYNFNATINLFNNGYFIAPANIASPNKIVGQAGRTVTYSVPLTADRFIGFSTRTSAVQTAASVAANVGMTTANEATFGYLLPAWGAGVVQNISGDVWGSTLENHWDAHEASGTLFQDEWLVLQMVGSIQPRGGAFTKKAIWLTGNNYFNGNGTFFNCSDESNNFIIANGSGAVQGVGPMDNSIFRGMVYVNTTNTGNMTYQFGSNSKMYGAIHHASATKFDINGGSADSAKIWFSEPLAQSGIQEIANTGILLAPGQSTAPVRTLVLKDVKIRPRLQFMQL